MGRPQSNITSKRLKYLQKALASLNDDLTKPWRDYPCLEWPFYKTESGYGQLDFWVNGFRFRIPVHRFAIQSVVGPMERDMLACHHCDNPACFRPVHLFPGTDMDNWMDAVAKGRQVSHTPPEFLRGEGNGRCKLTEDQILLMRELHHNGMGYRKLAKQFNVAKCTPAKICTGRTWGHISFLLPDLSGAAKPDSEKPE